MNENEKNPNPGELISEEQLDVVSGGATGDFSDPIQTSSCWFRPDGEEQADGRIKCRSECKGIIDSNGNPGSIILDGLGTNWRICGCWGSSWCVDKWHKECYRPRRSNW